MKYSNSIEYNISTKFDSSGLTKLQTQIREVELSLQKMSNAGNFEPTIEKARNSLQGLNKALTNAFNPSLGIIDISKFRAELAKGKVDLEGVASGFRLAGTQGQTAFNSLIGQLGRFDSGISHTSSALDKMFVTFQNTFRWGLISSFFSSFMNAIHQSVQYAKDLDDSLTQIMLVTDYSRDSMNEYAKAANEAAKAVGQTTVGMTNASLIFAQQGYDLNQSQQLATLSAKLANASQQDTAATSDQITAYMNAYGLQNSMDELVQAMDNWAKIANISAADVEEIALASQRAASMANAVGVSGEALAAQIATIESVTREAPEQIGNGLKTLYARFSDLKLGKDDEDGIGLGKVTSTLQQIGVQVVDAFGNVRDMDDIMEDLMVVWEDLDDTSKTAAAQALAGKHQVNRFMALMENADMYREYKGATGAEASGTLEQMNTEYLDSLQGRLTKLQSTFEGLFNDVFTTDMVYPLIDALTKLAETFDALFKSVGGGPTIILGLVSAFTQLFSKQIANTVTDASMNKELARIQAENYKNAPAALSQLGLANPNADNENTKNLLNFAQQGAQLSSNMSEEGIKRYNSLLDEHVRLANAAEEAETEFQERLASVNAIFGTTFKGVEGAFQDENGLNTSTLMETLRDLDDSALEGTQEKMQEAAAASEEYQKAISNLITAIKRYNDLSDKTTTEAQQQKQAIINSAESAKQAAKTIRSTGAITNEAFTNTKNSLDQIAKSTDNWEQQSKEATEAVEHLGAKAAASTKIIQDLATGKVEQVQTLRREANALDRADSNRQATQGAYQNVQNLGQGFLSTQELASLRKETLDFVGALGQVAFAVQSIQNLGRIWKDEDLSLTEKLTQSFLNLSVVIPSLITAFSKLKNVSSVIQLLTVKQTELAASAAAAAAAEEGFSIANKAVAISSTVASGAVGLLSEALLFFTSGPGLLVLAAIAAITFAINAQQEAAKKAKEEALEAFHETQEALQQTQSINDKADSFIDLYSNYDGSNGDRLIEQAENIALAMKDAGYESEGLEVHLAAVRAEASGTAEDFEHLADTIENYTNVTEARANFDVIEASSRVLEANNTSMEEMLTLQAAYKQANEDLYNLDVWDEDYEINRQNLEGLIAYLDDRIKANQESMDAANAAMQAQGTLAGMNALGFNYADERYTRGFTDDLIWVSDQFAAMSADAESLREFFNLNVQGFSLLTSAEQLDFMLQYIQDDAQKAGIQVQQLLEQNESLRSGDYTIMPGQYGATRSYTANDYRDITAAFQLNGFTAEESLKILATLDEDASREEILNSIDQIAAEMEANGGNLTLALKATLDADDLAGLERQVKDSISEMQPEDSDLNAETFQETARYFQEMAGNIEGIPEELQYSTEELQEFTEAVLRYDDALQDADDHLQDWIDTLNDSTSTISEQAEAFEGLRDLIGDLLDLDVTDLSHNFMQSTEALDLLNTAIYGTGEEADNAYSRLNALANLDMAGLLNWEDGMASLNDRFYDLSAAARDVGVAFEDVPNAASYAMEVAEGLMNGTITGPDINIDAFLAGLEQMVNSGQISFDEAMSIMDGAEIEADVTTETEDSTDTKESVGWEPYKTAGIQLTGRVPVSRITDGAEGKLGSGSYDILEGYVEGFDWRPITNTDFENKSITASAVGYKVKKGGSGGGGTGRVHFTNGRHKNSSGAAKRGASSGSGNHSRPSSGGSGGGCFVAGTLVSLQNQFKNIEDIQIGDIVLSYNEEIHQNEYSIVLQTMIHDVTEEIYDLYIEDEILTVTGIHRFYIRRKHDIEWIPASDLHIGDYVLFADGNWHSIFKIKVRIRSLLVYNFEVSHNHNYYVGRNQILAHNKGGKGGGGGSAKTIEKKEKKKHEKDYYEEVDSQLDKIKEELAGIEKQEDRLIGSKARANQQKQIALLNKEIILQERKLDILQKQEMPETKAKLDKSIAELGDILSKYGLNFNMPKLEYDEDGIISNFEDISRLITDKYNELVDKQGAIADSADEEANKQIEKAMSNFEKAGDETKKLIQRLNDLQKTQVEWTNAIQESKDAVEDLNIELYKTSLEAIENLKDLNKVHAEFAGFLSGFKSDSPLRALIEDLDELSNSYAVSADRVQDFYNTLIAEKEKAKESADDDEKAVIDKEIEYFQKKINEAAAGTETELWANGEVGYYLEALRELRKWMNGEEDEESPNIFDNNAKALYETYLDVYKKTKESALDYEKMVEDTVGDIIDIYDEVADKQEEFLEKYEHLAKQIERYADLYALAYGEDSYDILSQIGQQQANVLKSQLNQQWEMLRWWDAQIQQAEQEGNQDLLNSLQEQKQKVIDSIGDLAQDSAKAFVDAFEKAVDASTQNILEATFKDKNFDRLDRNWEWDSEYAKKYKDEIEKAYELDSLRNNYMELLNDAQGASLNTQNKIRKQMQEQLELLKNQTTVSQYDIDLANAKLLVLQKQIALEDAQRNKNQMQLRRDSQGNYRYVYRANQDDIAKARKELLDAEYEAYELTKNHAYQTFDDIKNAYDKYLSQRADLLKNFKGTEEELTQQIKEITDAFLRSITGSAEDANDMMVDAVDVLKWMVDNTSEETATAAQNMLNNILDGAGEIKDKTGIIWLDIFDFIKGALGEDAVKVIEQANDDSIKSWKGLRSELIGEDGILTAINKEITDNGGYTSAIDAAKTAIENLNIQTQSLLTDGLKPYNDAIDTNIGKINDWESALADARTTLEELEEDYKRISQIMGEDAAAKNTINIPETTSSSTTTPSNNTTTTTTTTTKPVTNTNNNKVSEAKAVAAYNWINGGRRGSNSFTNKELAAGQDLINLVYPTSLGGAGWSWDRALQYVLAKSYDTGGYTGEWGKNGKLAVLHQKELVLNAEDTRNILSAVDIVRQMTSTLGNALTNYSVGGAKSGLMNSAFGAVDQRVEIKAEFPNVRDAFEIETALTNLADKAYQYAHRKI